MKLIDIQEFLDLPQFQRFTDLEFCEWMIRTIGVAAVPGSSFFKEDVRNLIRLHFAREESTLDEALRRLEKLREFLAIHNKIKIWKTKKSFIEIWKTF